MTTAITMLVVPWSRGTSLDNCLRKNNLLCVVSGYHWLRGSYWDASYHTTASVLLTVMSQSPPEGDFFSSVENVKRLWCLTWAWIFVYRLHLKFTNQRNSKVLNDYTGKLKKEWSKPVKWLWCLAWAWILVYQLHLKFTNQRDSICNSNITMI